MPFEYHEPVHSEVVEKAIALAVELRAKYGLVDIAVLARQAVDSVFCTCVTSAADAVAKGEAPVHAGLVAEVRQQVEKRGIEHRDDADETIDRASEQSFPASDPPSWIWR